ncbi:putative DEAD box helicase involved in nonsense mediated decay [Aspergillus ibericus CBS 121593]|uniref:ATP binding protein n=1 Tax=Aspergillus ibericus CBS 121593 TaxID=1448316 RepID=A0A395GTH4_9EURO|nr:ATP binding protein [Aspergillus ibericus CBS 121593]RAK98890.1 ATP binding protein [Aspergillus ibericus CBS 121593]
MDLEDDFDPSLPSLSSVLGKLKVEPLYFANTDVKKYFVESNFENCEEWLKKPEVPSSEEIMGIYDSADDDDCIALETNRVDGPWQSKDAYLRAHYELLREDAIGPLRDAVAYVREDPKMMDSKVVSVYDKVYFTGITFAQRGLGLRIQFSTSRAGKSIAWEYTKRLVTGSIVALSPADDGFREKCVVATVAARPLEGVRQHPSEIDIFLARPEDIDLDPHKEWIMVEAKDGYYESVRHTLTALQKLKQEKFPLSEHICLLDPSIKAPDYVKEDPMVDIQSAVDGSSEGETLDILKDWPLAPSQIMDSTQWRALKKMLTKRLSVIQGPPGTGKTYVSVIALKILLANMKDGDPPIIVASQTNHALDQLLRHVATFEMDYVRIGSRSSDPDIKRRTLYFIRQNSPTITVHGSILGGAKKDHKSLTQAIINLLQPLMAGNSDKTFPASLFAEYGLLTETQLDYLTKGAKGWVRPGDVESTDPLVAWLGDEVAPFEVKYMTENFGFAEDEVDLEYEQLKELEAEQGLEEDDYETLKGHFAAIREGFCSHNFSCSEASALAHLKQPDLWKIKAEARGAVYDVLRKQLKLKIREQLLPLVSCYSKNCENLQIGKWERDYHILQTAKVIGMTATGLSKYRGLISSLNPKIVLIEEAAEVIEAPISAACFNSLQHMILVGDHRQLKGRCTVPELEGEPYNLGVSMFERLVNNGIKYVTLKRQRRMVPEIRQLLEPIYGELQDHESVCKRPGVMGMGAVRSYFFTHNWPESKDSLASKSNAMEAQMVAGFFVYLMQNGNALKDITILTFYNGQRKKILSLLRQHPYLQGQYVKVVTVDSYQGEENEIVILSLVRSGTKNIGFLSIENRVCVALSRARRGFYMFGNAMSLSNDSDLWRRVLTIMINNKPQPRLGAQLPVTCPSDWSKLNGGCDLPCDEMLDCGHPCPIKCHSFTHGQVRCNKTCGARMACKHVCNVPCAKTHICSCTCGLGPHFDYESQSSTAPSKKVRPQPEAIQRYQEYANGGAKKQDALLLEKATLMNVQVPCTPEKPKSGDLLLDFRPEEKGASSSPKVDSMGARVPQGNLLEV